MLEKMTTFIMQSGLANMDAGSAIMILVSFVLLYLAIVKKYEPLLLLPIAFGMFLANMPLGGITAAPIYDAAGKLTSPGGLLYYLYQGVKLGIYPPLIFLGIGAMTDFSPLIANPKSLLLGAAAQFGIFGTYRCYRYGLCSQGSRLYRHYWWCRWPYCHLPDL